MLIARSDAEVWMAIARAELGVRESAAGDNPRVLAYLASCERGTKPWIAKDETPWCSAFANWVLWQAKIPRTHSLAARSWERWAESCGLCTGAIVVLKRGVLPNQGHVGFCVDFTQTQLELLGGNQGNRVSVQAYPRSRIVAVRRPTEDMIRYRNTFHGV